MALVPKGVVVRIKSEKTYDHGLKPDTLATSIGEDFGHHYRGTWSEFENESGYTQFLLPEHYDVVGSPELAVQEPELFSGETGVEAEVLPSKVIYGVLNAEDEVYSTTSDRDYARELKAALGGKRKGIRIFQYAATKEIR